MRLKIDKQTVTIQITRGIVARQTKWNAYLCSHNTSIRQANQAEPPIKSIWASFKIVLSIFDKYHDRQKQTMIVVLTNNIPPVLSTV